MNDTFPYMPLMAFAMTGFICIMTETIPAGLLPEISKGMNISLASAGQWVTVYALGSLFAAIPLTIVTRSWNRKYVLLMTVAGFFIFNTITALSSNVYLTLLARLGAGAAAGLAWSLLAGFSRRIVDPLHQGRAMAIAMAGTPLALSLGVPLGTWLGHYLGWAPDVRYYVSTFAVTNDMDPYQRSGLCGAAKTSKNTVQESTGDPRGQAGSRGRTDLDACTQYPLHLYRTVFVIIRYGGPC
ncbi:major facilitator superfamily transporter [Klebsiella michiganensis]|nr:major facilitator superfamily transporter [Klebsiella michiganensis]